MPRGAKLLRKDDQKELIINPKIPDPRSHQMRAPSPERSSLVHDGMVPFSVVGTLPSAGSRSRLRFIRWWRISPQL